MGGITLDAKFLLQTAKEIQDVIYLDFIKLRNLNIWWGGIHSLYRLQLGEMNVNLCENHQSTAQIPSKLFLVHNL